MQKLKKTQTRMKNLKKAGKAVCIYKKVKLQIKLTYPLKCSVIR